MKTRFAFLMGLALVTGAAFAQDAPTLKVTIPATAKPGETVKGTVTVTFADGWHGYQNPPSDPYQNPVTVTVDTKGFKLKKATYPKGVVKEMSGAKTAVYEGQISIPVEITVPKQVGKTKVTITVSFQQCNEGTCLPPSAAALKTDITIAKAKGH